ncbi:unnamed protein product, partial [Amoebophrya sp. A25]
GNPCPWTDAKNRVRGYCGFCDCCDANPPDSEIVLERIFGMGGVKEKDHTGRSVHQAGGASSSMTLTKD